MRKRPKSPLGAPLWAEPRRTYVAVCGVLGRPFFGRFVVGWTVGG